MLNNKYIVNGNIYNEFKQKYEHLDFNDNDIKIIMEDIKENENKLLYLKNMVINTETKRKIIFNAKNEEEKKKWQNSMRNMEKFKIKKIKESWEPAMKYKLLCQNYFKRNGVKMAKKSDNFDNNLKFLVDETGKKNNREQMNSEILMLRMRQKLDEKMKNKKDKEKRERKRLKEEQQINYRLFSQKSMGDMVDLMENNILKKNMGFDKPIKRKEEVNNNINKNNETVNEGNNSETNKGKNRNKNLNKSENINNNEKTDNTEFKPIEENDKIINENEIKDEALEKNKMGQTATSSYSKLTTNDYGAGLIKECFSIHDFNININDRIKLFKTLIFPINKETENKYKNLPKVYINTNSTNQSLIKNYSCSNIFDKSISFNNSNIKFDKNLYFEEIDKLNLEDFSLEYKKKLIKFEKKKI
jgi:hypothetical protein